MVQNEWYNIEIGYPTVDMDSKSAIHSNYSKSTVKQEKSNQLRVS